MILETDRALNECAAAVSLAIQPSREQLLSLEGTEHVQATGG
ncbi:hypothetical protein PIL02S_04978 [Paenibacillus illinoisensis]|uniref:Uncharacterized protein n=1 Tax=Paenibacillus illinoisensis TaxID=59845 RepID=A0A2W0CTY5_9BACL|nr:hypothetical protein PIL02S_04978 [Paenibacillus illinoisensis]